MSRAIFLNLPNLFHLAFLCLLFSTLIPSKAIETHVSCQNSTEQSFVESCKHHRYWSQDSFRIGVVIGYAASFLAVVVALMPYELPSNWVKFKTGNKKLKVRRKIKMREYDQETEYPDNLLQGGRQILKLEKMVTRLPYTDLRNATNNFNEKNLIGMGKMGITFKATLPTGNFLVLKKLHYYQFLDEQFIAELKILGILRHINLLPLVGFCMKSKERLLVYKYMPNGRLYDWLKNKSEVLYWPLRAKIAVGLARGLAWLHQGCNIRVIHLNISSKCILLDHNFEPKLSNFGEAMIVIPSSNSNVNPEYWEMAFAKEDVYDFGIVLLELVTGEDSSNKSLDGSPNEWVNDLLDRNSSTFHDLIDKSIIGEGFADENIYQFVEVAFSCIASIADQRPTMQQVYEHINKVGEMYGLSDVSQLERKTETSTSRHKGKSVEIEIIPTE